MSSAERARLAAGFDLATAAKCARISVPYLRSFERGNVPPYSTAGRLARLFNCPIDTFIEGARNGTKQGGTHRKCEPATKPNKLRLI